jgi:hypothetical protein
LGFVAFGCFIYIYLHLFYRNIIFDLCLFFIDAHFFQEHNQRVTKTLLSKQSKFHPRTGREGPSLTLALDSGVCGQHHATAALRLGKETCTHHAGGWVGPRTSLDNCRKSRPPPGFDPQPIQPIASHYIT